MGNRYAYTSRRIEEELGITISGQGVSPAIQTLNGTQNTTTTRILAHELGHLTGTDVDGPGAMNNVNQYENPIMTPIDGYSRTQY